MLQHLSERARLHHVLPLPRLNLAGQLPEQVEAPDLGHELVGQDRSSRTTAEKMSPTSSETTVFETFYAFSLGSHAAAGRASAAVSRSAPRTICIPSRLAFVVYMSLSPSGVYAPFE